MDQFNVIRRKKCIKELEKINPMITNNKAEVEVKQKYKSE